MSPPPKPLALRRETLVWLIANGPLTASMLEVVGAGPRSYGLSAATAVVDAVAIPPPARARVRVSRTARAVKRLVAGLRSIGCTTVYSPCSGPLGAAAAGCRPGRKPLRS
jgi:hypothetical protein